MIGIVFLITERKRGRPRVEFFDASNRSKIRKLSSGCNDEINQKVLESASLTLKNNSNKDGAVLLTEIFESPETSTNLLNIFKKVKNNNVPEKMTTQQALSLYICCNMTVNIYRSIREQALANNHDLYPSYYDLHKAKLECIPPNVKYSEEICEVPLQDLLNHTVERFFEQLNIQENNEGIKDLLFVLKYGFDGTWAHQYNQKWADEDLKDSSLFSTSLVPLQIKEVENNTFLWKNPRHSSTRYCRPIRFQWIKETEELSKEEKAYMENQINELKPYLLKGYKVYYKMILTMIDGKVS